MPDWSYQPLFRPLLFRLPSRKARKFALGPIGWLANMPFGLKVIDMMGHMRPQPSEVTNVMGKEWISRVGLGAGLTFEASALRAFSHFGFGYLEVGPITLSPVDASQVPIVRAEAIKALGYPVLPENPGLQIMVEELEKESQFKDRAAHLGARLANHPASAYKEALQQYQILINSLDPFVDFFTIDTRWWAPFWTDSQRAELLRTIKHRLHSDKLLFLLVSPDSQLEKVEALTKLAIDYRLSGMMVGGGQVQQDEIICGAPTRAASINLVAHIRRLAPDMTIIGSGGVIEPQDALDFMNAGATFVQLHSGFVYSGPGLPKRINEALNSQRFENLTPLNKTPALCQGWLGFALVAIGLMVAGSLVLHVGLTSVILPYDEAFLGVTIVMIPDLNAHLLHFMSHDRVTLAGTALSGATLYLFLALSGIKAGHHWAYRTSIIAVGAGFLSFFLYLGFQYFDPLHALVCVLVLPFYLWGVMKPPVFVPERSLNMRNDAAWMKSLWGQLLFIWIGVGLVLAGITIAIVGCTTVFVNEDLMFMQTTREAIAAMNPKLIPLISHDRASFGGCLWSVGLVVLLISLQGYRQGSRWVWWALFLGGLPGFLAVLGIHFSVGYTHFIHLFPAYIAFAMYVLGLYLSYEYLCLKPAPTLQHSENS